MASTYRIVVTVDPSRAVRGAQKTSKSLDKTTASVNRLKSAMQGAFVVLGIIAVTRALVNLTNTYTNVQNRLRLVTTGTKNLASTTKELFEIASRTRQSFMGTAETFTRVSLATRDMGISQQEALSFTESLNQAILLSGATARESAAGMIQFSQGLASGALRGDELRSVLEQLPGIADVLQDALGVTRGELRKMGEQGLLTTKLILDAFKKMRGEIAGKFKNVVFTAAQEWERFNTKLLEVIGTMDAFLGGNRALAAAIGFLADNLDIIIPLIASIIFLIGTQLALVAIPAAILAVKAFTVALLANPIGLFVAALLVALNTIYFFRDELASVFFFIKALWQKFGIDIIEQYVITPFNNLVAYLSAIFLPAWQAVKDFMETMWLKFGPLIETWILDPIRAVIAVIRQVIEMIKRAIDWAKNLTREAQKAAAATAAASAASSAASASRRAGGGGSGTGTGTGTGAKGDIGASESRFTEAGSGDIFGDSSFTDFGNGLRGTRGPDTGFADLSSNSNRVNNDFARGGDFAAAAASGRAMGRIGGEQVFANGGSIRVGGDAGIDRNLLSINGKPTALVGRGETIEVKPNKKPKSLENSRSGGGNTFVTNINVETKDIKGFNSSRGQIQAKVHASQKRAALRNN